MLGRRGIRSHANSKPARNEYHNYFNYKISANVKIERSLDSSAVCEFFENKNCFKCSIVSSKDVYQLRSYKMRMVYYGFVVIVESVSLESRKCCVESLSWNTHRQNLR